jgi:aspartate/methionine/tyrosine aminotransferase
LDQIPKTVKTSCKPKEIFMVVQFLAPASRKVNYPWNGLLAQAGEAKGSRINGTLGVFLDDDLKIGILPAVAELVKLDRSKVTEYAPSHGVLALRELWRDRLVSQGHFHPDALAEISLPIVTAGLTDGLSIAGQMFLEPGQSELVTATPNWPNYALIYQDIQNAKIREFPIFERPARGDTYTPSIANLMAALQASDRAVSQALPIVLLLNLPHNPTGYSYTQAESEQIILGLREFLDTHPTRRVVVLVDDAYAGFNYDPKIRKHSFFRDLAHLHNRLLTVHISGATKEIYAWGLRVGFISFGGLGLSRADLKVLEDKAAAYIRGTLSNVSMLSQHLTIEALKSASTEQVHAQYYATLQRRFDRCRKELERAEVAEYYEALPFNSGYFFALRIRDGRVNSETVRKTLLEKHSVGVVTIGPELVRIAFSALTETQVPTLFTALIDTAKAIQGNNGH